MKYVCALLTVADMARSKDFYIKLLGRSVEADFGANVAFDDGFSLHLRDHFRGVVGREVRRGENDVELYFEEEEFAALESRLRSAGVEFIHGAVEQPWRQIAMRFLDPDGYVVEVGEPLERSVARLAAGGMSADEIVKATGLSADFVRTCS
jgi:catechol 2,3-dioxygenase-like lactoylglutathione lyase family enzyme